MPIGCSSLVPTIATQLQVARPRSVLDLGIGMGFYGAVVRPWLDFGVRPWRTKLVGVEGFAAHRNPCWDLYNEVVVSSIEEYLATATEAWDAILLLDVLEHFPHAAGEPILAAARGRLSPDGPLFVGTPAVWMEALRDAGFALIVGGQPDPFGHQILLATTSSG
jgi:predicted TPR repeat methyltransferase